MAQYTFTDGEVLTATLLNTYASHEGGAWTSFTPQIDQGATTDIAKTVTYSKYARAGRQIIWIFSVSLTGAGTNGANVTLTLPVTASAASAVAGTGQVYDATGPTRYPGVIEGTSTTKALYYTATSTTNGWGATPSVALASGDGLSGVVIYEAAS